MDLPVRAACAAPSDTQAKKLQLCMPPALSSGKSAGTVGGLIAPVLPSKAGPELAGIDAEGCEAHSILDLTAAASNSWRPDALLASLGPMPNFVPACGKQSHGLQGDV